MTDESIIQEIRAGKPDKSIKHLYRELPKIRAIVLKSGGSKTEAKGIFHDGLILLIEKVEKPEFELTSKLSTYLYGICRFLWLNELKKQHKKAPEISIESDFEDLNDSYDFEKEEKIKLMERAFASISPICQEIIKRFYYLKQSLGDIAKALNASSVNSIKTRKYKCLERAIQLTKKIQAQ
ncbi:MAG: sigma-70 family RNA polymerase sigma factor [Flavobacteriales bacterium]|nr:sigma-70 family RNA polymerase sigma factor [Flavobacteriales bacterium]